MADTLPIVYLNGGFQPIGEARVSPLDRGFLFADAVYEVIPVFQGKPMLLEAHLLRLERSLGELRIPNPGTLEQWCSIVTELIERNGGGNLGIYVQISRGAHSGRDHVFPDNVTPTVFAMATAIADLDAKQPGVTAITLPDIRWGRCDIKSTALIANVLARQHAKESGASEAILLRDGKVTEGSSTSVIIVENGVLITRGNSYELLPGTTRELVLELARENGLSYREATVSEAQLRAADEVWLMSATRGIVPVVGIDGAVVGDGKPGPVWHRVNSLFAAYKAGTGNE